MNYKKLGFTKETEEVITEMLFSVKDENFQLCENVLRQKNIYSELTDREFFLLIFGILTAQAYFENK